MELPAVFQFEFFRRLTLIISALICVYSIPESAGINYNFQNDTLPNCRVRIIKGDKKKAGMNIIIHCRLGRLTF